MGSLVYLNKAMRALKQLLTFLSVHFCTLDGELETTRSLTTAGSANRQPS